MSEEKEFRGVLVQVFINPYCVKKDVVDVESGEVVLSKTEGDVKAAFANGYNACPVEVMVSREVMENGTEYRSVNDFKDEGVTYLQGWYGGRRKKQEGGKERTRGGKPINVPSVGENMLVTAIDAATHTLTVTRGFGSVAAVASIADDAEVLVLGSAMPENSGDRGAKSTQETAKYNYTQIFRTPVALSSTEEASKLYGSQDRDYQRRKAAAEHKRDIAHALYFGQKKEVTNSTSSMPQRTTGGIVEFLKTGSNTVAFDSTSKKLTYTNFDNYVAQLLFSHGSENKLLIAGPNLATAINSWAAGKLITEVGADKTYGIRINKLTTSYGDLPILYDPLLTGVYGAYGFALDLDNVRYAYLDGRDTKLKTNIQDNDVDGIIDEYITECGLEVKNANTHVLITGAYVTLDA